MAARHYIPAVNAQDFGPERRLPVPAFPEMPVRGFRTGGSVEEVLECLANEPRVKLDAAFSAGKSTRTPAALRAAGYKLVVHAVPSRLLAVSLNEYLSHSTEPGVADTVCLTDYEAGRFPTSGVVRISTSVLWRYMVDWYREPAKAPGFVLLLDEAHESDAATSVLRQLKTAAPGVDKYVEATATHGAGAGVGFRRSERPAKATQATYAPESVTDWDVMSMGKPWSVAEFPGDTVVFCDDPDHSEHLRIVFEDAGCVSRVFTALSSVKDFKQVMGDMATRPKGCGSFVLILDYSFRSGFTFPSVRRIIDTALVARMVVEQRAPRVVYRPAYEFEVAQAEARGARVAGMNCEYFRPKYEPKKVRVEVEGTEADLVPLMLRALGYAPPKSYRDTPFYEGEVPGRLGLKLGMRTPLRMYSDRVEWPKPASVVDDRSGYVVPELPMEVSTSLGVSGRAARSGFDTGSPVSPVSLADFGVDSGDPGDGSGGGGRVVVSTHLGPSDRDTLDAFSELQKQHDMRGYKFKFGDYVYVAGCDDPNVGKGAFSDGFDGLMGFWKKENGSVYVQAMDPVFKRQVLALALDAYNTSLSAAYAARHVMTKAADNGGGLLVQMGRGVVDSWSTALRDEFLKSMARARTAGEMLSSLAPEEMERLEPLVGLETRAVTGYTIRLLRGVEVGMVGGVGDRQGYMQRMNGRRDGYEEPWGSSGMLLEPGGGSYGDISGRYRVVTGPDNDLRAKLAGLVLGDRVADLQLTYR